MSGRTAFRGSSAASRRRSAPPPPPPPGKRTAFAHTPTPLTQTRARINAGWATGAAMYGDAGAADLWDYGMVSPILNEFPEGVDLYMMPKNFTVASLNNLVANTTPAQRARMWMCNGQEPEDDDNKQSAAARQAERSLTQDMISVCRPAGIKVGIHLQTWTTYPTNNAPWGGSVNGPLTITAFMPQAGDNFGSEPLDFVGGTMLDRNQNNSAAAQLAPFITAVRAAQPDVTIHMTNASWSVPLGASAALIADRDAAYLIALTQIEQRLPSSFIGWFDFDWTAVDGSDYRVSPYPNLEQMLVDFADGLIP